MFGRLANSSLHLLGQSWHLSMKLSTDIIRMVEFLIDNIYVEFVGHVYHQTVGIPTGTNCAPLAADLFLYNMKLILYNICKRVSSRSSMIILILFIRRT